MTNSDPRTPSTSAIPTLARATFTVREGAKRTIKLARIEELPDGTVIATYASGRSYEYLSMAEVLQSHRLSLADLQRVR
jgi:hypothetical protein